jgi:ATP-dependent DNA helicase PIF1
LHSRDLRYNNLLQRARLGDLTMEDEAFLYTSRMITGVFSYHQLRDWIILCPTKSRAELHNVQLLSLLPSATSIFLAEDSFDPQHYFPGLLEAANDILTLEMTLHLKENARVMLRKNLDVDRGLVNGAIGIVQSIQTDYVRVYFPHSDIHHCIYKHRETTDILHINYSRKQFPLCLAYSMTIHKCQGLTISKAIIDFGDRGCFDYGQAYVALSRVKSLDNVMFLGWQNNQFQADPVALSFYQQLE